VETDCLDGVDNDGDGHVDCADPDCTDYACVVAPPKGWQGFFWYRTVAWSDNPADPETCPDASQAIRYNEEPAGDLTCACSCDLQGTVCLPAPISCTSKNGNCGGAKDWTDELSSGSCEKPDSGNDLSCKLTGPPVLDDTGSCEPEMVVGNKNPFALFHDVCGEAMTGGTGCGSGVCVPKPVAPYDSGACIRKAGTEMCPSGWGDEHHVHEGFDDERVCTDCTCGEDLSNLACEGTEYTAYDHNGCGGSTEIISTEQCIDMSYLADVFTWGMRLTTPPAPTGGTCTALGGDPQGAVATSGPVTYCCVP